MIKVSKRLCNIFILTAATYTPISIASSEIISVAAVYALPPYVMEDGHSGIEIEILRSALSQSRNIVLRLDYIPADRMHEEIQSGHFMAGLTAVEDETKTDLFFSDVHVEYQNVLVALKDSKISVKNLSDLNKIKVVGFKNARKYLGREFSNAILNNKNYSERTSMESSVKQLFSQRTEAIIIDRYIFEFISKQMGLDKNKAEYFEIFDKNPMRVAFKTEAMRDEFNKGLYSIRKSGIYNEILKKYTQ
ncbi:substrate-binding periplasmic protein [Bowmanella yangjiangensis]|uniref:Transporter substrate-binding domain-containing protein n=1 Tax=Bowmanella yangjiangensis TaxID=2811230 RepID=A0ABS3CRJ1_9ALTE|nr:transporter substrate-binding domain-containing protein [Bowmanella yangjiangensis]MBN7819728.1 transporter substrate-binding domain-containing protein [Bowmanella yangjiangensis]